VRHDTSALSQANILQQIDQNCKDNFDGNDASHQISFESNSVIDQGVTNIDIAITENINFVGNVENLD